MIVALVKMYFDRSQTKTTRKNKWRLFFMPITRIKNKLLLRWLLNK